MSQKSYIQLKQKVDRWLDNDDRIAYEALHSFWLKLHRWLEQLQTAELTSEERLSLLTHFFNLGPHLMEHSDDEGTLGDVFCTSATRLFWDHAVLCVDRKHVLQCLLAILSQEDYGLVTDLFDQVADKLPAPDREDLEAQIWGIFVVKGTAKWASLLKSLLILTPRGQVGVSRLREAEMAVNQDLLAVAEACLRKGQPHQAGEHLAKMTHHWKDPIKEKADVLFAEKLARCQRALEIWKDADKAIRRYQTDYLLRELPEEYQVGVGDYFGQMLLKQKTPVNGLIHTLIQLGRPELLVKWVHQAPDSLARQGTGRLQSLAATLGRAGFCDESIQIYRHLIEKELSKKKTASYKRAIIFLDRAEEVQASHPSSLLETPESFRQRLKQTYKSCNAFCRLLTEHENQGLDDGPQETLSGRPEQPSSPPTQE